MCSVPMMIDSDERCAPTSIRFGMRSQYSGGGVNPHGGSMSRRSNIKKWRARMLMHRKIRKSIEKKREKVMNEHEQSVIGSRMKRRKSFRQEESVNETINFDHINSLNSFQARMYLLKKVRFVSGDFPEELVGQCILSDTRKRMVFQESVRMSCAATASAVSGNNGYVSPTAPVINPTYNGNGFIYVAPTVIHPTYIY